MTIVCMYKQTRDGNLYVHKKLKIESYKCSISTTCASGKADLNTRVIKSKRAPNTQMSEVNCLRNIMMRKHTRPTT